MTDLADKCTENFKPAKDGKPASAKCCTSDITLEEFRTLCGKMDGFNADAKTVEEYVMGTPDWRTDLYATCGTLLTHKESIELFLDLGVEMGPELKSPEVKMPFKGLYTHDMLRMQLIHDYIEMRVPATSVWPQSFNLDDVAFWVNNAGRYGRQTVFLDERELDTSDPDSFKPTMKEVADAGVYVISPAQQMLLTLDAFNNIIPSEYAHAAKAGLNIISWSFDRAGPLPANRDDYYYSSVSAAMNNDGDMFKLIHVLAQEVGVIAMFSDWVATVTYYASCFGL